MTVTKPAPRVRPIHIAWGLALLFFAAGQPFINRVGVEADEALFLSPLLNPRNAVYTRLFHHPWPVLLMSYLGTLKTLIYNPIVHIFGCNLWSLREPVLLAGAFTIVLFFLLLRRASGDLAALIGCGLLATDSIYLITTCYDWGPVALQHLLILSGALLAMHFCESKRLLPLAGAFFLWGLAMWDKALAVWLLSSMGVAAVAVFPRYLVGMLTRRRVAIALLGFTLGAFPLLWFNAKSHWVTFRGNFTRDEHFYRKLPSLLYTLNGEGLFGWMMPFPNDPVPSPHSPDSRLTAASANISSLAGHPVTDWMVYALGLAVLLTPLARGRDLRTILFCMVVLVGGWLQMALTSGAGGSAHHTILLWPLPQAIVAVALASASRRLGRAGKPAAAVVVAALMISNALVLNEYFAVLWRSGPTGGGWSRAILPLSDYLKNSTARHVFAADWGILEPLRFLNAGRLPLENGADPIAQPALDAADERRLIGMLDTADHLYILHTKEAEVFPDIRDKLLRFVSAHGYTREVLMQIPDGYGRQVFEVCRFSKAGPE
jgi:4-amino-4-deoxy-L-arabinose transferase-like glycosyltransferase